LEIECEVKQRTTGAIDDIVDVVEETVHTRNSVEDGNGDDNDTDVDVEVDE